MVDSAKLQVSDRVAVVLVGHGSRHDSANAEFADLVGSVTRVCPDLDVYGAYLELAVPSVEDVLVEVVPNHLRVLVVPLLLFAAAHVKRDVPRLVNGVRDVMAPGGAMHVASALGESQAVWALAIDLLHVEPSELASSTESILVVRGSSDLEATVSAREVARYVGVHVGQHVNVAYLAAAHPDLTSALASAVGRGAVSIGVLPYLMSGGALVGTVELECAEFQRAHSEVDVRLTPHLGAHHRLGEATVAHVRAQLRACSW